MSHRAPAAAAFKTPEAAATFFAAYDAVLRQWPVPVESVAVTSACGTTQVNICGPEDGAPLVLLPGGGATSTVWFANVAALSRGRRVYAVDVLGDVGRSVRAGQRLRTRGDLMARLDAVFGQLGLDSVDLAGHSYGGWLALSYTLHAPSRVRRLALLDPTSCFAGMKPSYLRRGVPLLIRPSAKRMRALIEWETRGAAVDPAWLTLLALGAAEFRSNIVMPRRPAAERLRACTTPTLLLLAEKSRSHDIRRVAANARLLMPHAVIQTLPGVSHHMIPTEEPAQLNDGLLAFFA